MDSVLVVPWVTPFVSRALRGTALTGSEEGRTASTTAATRTAVTPPTTNHETGDCSILLGTCDTPHKVPPTPPFRKRSGFRSRPSCRASDPAILHRVKKPDYPRALTARERDALGYLLAADFPGVEALRRQATVATVTDGCACGCATIDLSVDSNLAPPAVATRVWKRNVLTPAVRPAGVVGAPRNRLLRRPDPG